MPDAKKAIMVVDDQECLLRTTTAMLLRAGYSPIPASGPFAALTRFRDFEGEISLLLTDLRMPEMSGLTLAQQIMAQRSDIRVLLMSGSGSACSRLPLLRKPFSQAQLLKSVADALASAPPLASDVFTDETSSSAGARATLMQEVELTRNNYAPGHSYRTPIALPEIAPSDSGL